MSSLIRKVTSTVKKGYKFMIESYDGAMAVVEDCKKRSITNSIFDNMSTQSMGSFEGVKSYEEALDLLHNGYQPTVDKLKSKLSGRLVSESKRISFSNDVVGYAPIVPLAIKGVPNCMINSTMKPIKAKVVDIYYDMACSCDTNSEQILENGKNILSAVIDLENQGYRINLYAMQAYADSDSCDILTVKVKSSNQPLDLKRISFPFTHTAFFRVIGFDWYSKSPKAKYRGGYGHSVVREFNSKLNEAMKEVFGKSSVYISGTKIMEKGEDYIREVIKNESGNNK